jgi:hypothetical protein
MVCQLNHRYETDFSNLPDDQGGEGRHKCAGCAYELGLEAGRRLDVNFTLDLNTLNESQAGTVRHKSHHAAFAKGYMDGVNEYYS